MFLQWIRKYELNIYNSLSIYIYVLIYIYEYCCTTVDGYEISLSRTQLNHPGHSLCAELTEQLGKLYHTLYTDVHMDNSYTLWDMQFEFVNTTYMINSFHFFPSKFLLKAVAMVCGQYELGISEPWHSIRVSSHAAIKAIADLQISWIKAAQRRDENEYYPSFCTLNNNTTKKWRAKRREGKTCTPL